MVTGRPSMLDGRGDVAGIALAAEAAPVDRMKRQARDDGDAVIALLAVDLDVLVAGAAKRLQRKVGVRALRLLQAENVRLLFAQEPRDEADPQPDRVDVPGGDGKRHRGDGEREESLVAASRSAKSSAAAASPHEKAPGLFPDRAPAGSPKLGAGLPRDTGGVCRRAASSASP